MTKHDNTSLQLQSEQVINANTLNAEFNNKRVKDCKSAGRLLSIPQAAAYSGLSACYIRDLVADRIIKICRLPGSRIRSKGGKVICHTTEHLMRKIMIDRADLDQFIDSSKE